VDKRSIKKTLSFIISIVICFFIARYAQTSLAQIHKQDLSINWVMIIISFFWGILGFFLYSLGWFFLLRMHDHTVRFGEVNYLLTKGNLGKYIPGRIWQFLGRLYLFNGMGISKGKIMMMAVVEQYYLILSALMIFCITFFLSGDAFPSAFVSQFNIPVIICIIFGVIGLHPKVFALLSEFLQKITKKDYLQMTMTWMHSIFLFMLYSFYWMSAGLSVLFLIKGGIMIPPQYLLFIIGSNAISYVIGYLALITPNGLGIREGILTYLLELFMIKGMGAAVSLLSRFLLIIQEVGYFFFSLLIFSITKRQERADTHISDRKFRSFIG